MELDAAGSGRADPFQISIKIGVVLVRRLPLVGGEDEGGCFFASMVPRPNRMAATSPSDAAGSFCRVAPAVSEPTSSATPAKASTSAGIYCNVGRSPSIG